MDFLKIVFLVVFLVSFQACSNDDGTKMPDGTLTLYELTSDQVSMLDWYLSEGMEKLWDEEKCCIWVALHKKEFEEAICLDEYQHCITENPCLAPTIVNCELETMNRNECDQALVHHVTTCMDDMLDAMSAVARVMTCADDFPDLKLNEIKSCQTLDIIVSQHI